MNPTDPPKPELREQIADAIAAAVSPGQWRGAYWTAADAVLPPDRPALAESCICGHTRAGHLGTEGRCYGGDCTCPEFELAAAPAPSPDPPSEQDIETDDPGATQPPWATWDIPALDTYLSSEVFVAGALSTMQFAARFHPAWCLPIARRALDALGEWEPDDTDTLAAAGSPEPGDDGTPDSLTIEVLTRDARFLAPSYERATGALGRIGAACRAALGEDRP